MPPSTLFDTFHPPAGKLQYDIELLNTLSGLFLNLFRVWKTTLSVLE